MDLVFQLFECQVQVGNLCPVRGEGGGGGCSGFQVTRMPEWGKNQNPKKFLGFPTEPKNVMGPLLTSKVKKRNTRSALSLEVGIE